MIKTLARTYLVALLVTMPGFTQADDDVHPLMTSKYWGNVGVYFSARDFDASASGSIGGMTR